MRVRCCTCHLCRGAVEFDTAVVELVQLQPKTRPTERVGQHDVGAGVDVVGVHCGDSVGMVDVPHLRWVARSESPSEELGSHRAVDQQGAPLSEQIVKNVHLHSLPRV
jgi:hypothetical protein